MTNDFPPDDTPLWRPEPSPAVARALAKWPNVPDCYGWLALDRRGRWRIGGALISHPGTNVFLHANYASAADGGWFVRNGPQRAWVDLDLAPWIVSVDADGRLRFQSGENLELPREILITEHGDVLFATARGLAAVSDRDLLAFLRPFTMDGDGDALERLAELAPGATLALHDSAGTSYRATGAREDEVLIRYRVQRRPRP